MSPLWKNCIVDGFRLCSFAENAEFVDDITTFRDLAGHLQSSGCHLAKLSAAELSVKHGVGGCFRSLLRQLLADVPDVSDMLNLLRCTISTTSQSDENYVTIDYNYVLEAMCRWSKGCAGASDENGWSSHREER